MEGQVLIILGDDPAGEQQYHYTDLLCTHHLHPRVLSVNRSYLRIPGCHIDYLASVHEEELLAHLPHCPGAQPIRLYPRGRWEPAKKGMRYHAQGHFRSGGSALGAIGAGLTMGFERIVVIGVGLTGEYVGFRPGWEKAVPYMENKVRGTGEFLESLLGPIPTNWFT